MAFVKHDAVAMGGLLNLPFQTKLENKELYKNQTFAI
jgi:hypothetical protein